MPKKDLKDLSDQEILKNWKAVKSANIIIGFCFVLLLLVTIYRAMSNGYGVFMLGPVFVAILGVSNFVKYKAVEKEIDFRNLK